MVKDFLKKKIFPNTSIVSLGLFFKKENILAIGDLHFGLEEELNVRGILVPRKNFEKVKKEFEYIFKKIGKVRKTILLGDIKHGFGKTNNQEWRETIELIEFLEKKSEEIIMIRGNHDTLIEKIASWKKVRVFEKFEEGDYCFCHGDKQIVTKKKKIVMGHEHPAIVLEDEYRREKFKSIIKTKIYEKEIIILPSFNFLSIGTDFKREKLMSPYLKKMREFEAWVIEGKKSFYFGKIIRKN